MQLYCFGIIVCESKIIVCESKLGICMAQPHICKDTGTQLACSQLPWGIAAQHCILLHEQARKCRITDRVDLSTLPQLVSFVHFSLPIQMPRSGVVGVEITLLFVRTTPTQ